MGTGVNGCKAFNNKYTSMAMQLVKSANIDWAEGKNSPERMLTYEAVRDIRLGHKTNQSLHMHHILVFLI